MLSSNFLEGVLSHLFRLLFCVPNCNLMFNNAVFDTSV